jgi:hypothetical protein
MDERALNRYVKWLDAETRRLSRIKEWGEISYKLDTETRRSVVFINDRRDDKEGAFESRTIVLFEKEKKVGPENKCGRTNKQPHITFFQRQARYIKVLSFGELFVWYWQLRIMKINDKIDGMSWGSLVFLLNTSLS